jgi:hypothetical protein
MARNPPQAEAAMRTGGKKRNTEFCNLCGRSVVPGTGWFVNRVSDPTTPADRRAAGRPFPLGDWICAECMESWPCGEAGPRKGRQRK